MATINSAPKTAYVYDEDTSSWYAIGGNTNTVANYTWSGTHNFQNTVTFEDAIKNIEYPLEGLETKESQKLFELINHPAEEIKKSTLDWNISLFRRWWNG